MGHCYQLLAQRVKISLAKTLMSDCGGLEFAKKFCIHDRELSPLSLKMIRSTRFSVAFMPVLKSIGSSSFLVSLRLKGAGYRRYSSSAKEYLNITDIGIGTFWWPSRLVESYHYHFLSDRSLACGREERSLLALYLKESKEKIDIALPGRSKCTFVTEVSREEITLNGLPVLLYPLQKGRSDSLIGEDLIKRPMASRIRSFI